VKTLSRIGLHIARRLPGGYWRLIRFLAERDSALWDCEIPLRLVPGRTIRADLREPVFAGLVRYGCYPHQSGEDRLLRRLLRSGDVVYDIGANVGYTALLFLDCVKPTGRVVAFEPSPRAFRLLERNLTDEPMAEAVNLAISDSTARLDFFETKRLDTSSLLPVTGVRPITVQVETTENVVAGRERPTFVKIDVEGNEPAVIRSMGSLNRGIGAFPVFFEALSHEALGRCLEALTCSIDRPFLVFRASRAGTLVGLDDAALGTNNYLAIPSVQGQRVTRLSRGTPTVVVPSRGERS
jgi:FkbM family methyltransferase